MKGMRVLVVVLAIGTQSPVIGATDVRLSEREESNASPPLVEQSNRANPAEALEAAIAQLVETGLSGGSRARIQSRPTSLMSVVMDEGSAVNFVPTHEVNLKLPFRFGTTDSMLVDRIVELRELFSTSCESHGGTLIPHGSINPRAIHASYPRAGSSLIQAQALGRFTCSNESVPLFHLEITPINGPVDVRVTGIGHDRSIRMQETHTARTQAAERVQQSLVPGDKVSVHVSHVPTDIRPKILGLSDYYLCSMVLQVTPPLAQLQIGSKTIFMEISKIQPDWPEVSLRGPGPFTSGRGRCFTD